MHRFIEKHELNSMMSPSIIILQGGEDVRNRDNESLIRHVGELSTSKKIVVIPWTSNSISREAKYRSIYSRYFADSGFEEVIYIEREDPEAVTERKFASADVLYLPGGDSEILYREIKARTLQERLATFPGIIVGNSAGAIVLSRGGVSDGIFHPGLGIVKFCVSVHYAISDNVSTGNPERLSVNIPEGMWISISES